MKENVSEKFSLFASLSNLQESHVKKNNSKNVLTSQMNEKEKGKAVTRKCQNDIWFHFVSFQSYGKSKKNVT